MPVMGFHVKTNPNSGGEGPNYGFLWEWKGSGDACMGAGKAIELVEIT
jgi:hypothetical protein